MSDNKPTDKDFFTLDDSGYIKYDLSFIKEPLELIIPSKLVSELDKYVIGQGAAKKALAITLANHQVIAEHNIKDPTVALKRSNLLLVGPSGSGKTYLVETMAKVFDRPLLTIDITHYTQAGYIGKDVDGILEDLLNVYKGKEDQMYNAIIFIDEIDKIRGQGGKGDRAGVSTGGVQRQLLKMIDGGIQQIETGHKGRSDRIEFDTTNILWIFGGAFTDFFDGKASKANKLIGFGENKSESDIKREAHEMTHEDLIESGLFREFVGRIGTIAVLDALSKDDYKRILIEPVNSILKQAELLADLRGIDLKFSEEDVEVLAEEAMQLGVGARGLKIVVDKLVQDKMYI